MKRPVFGVFSHFRRGNSSLEKRTTVVRFKAETTPRTFGGKLKVAVTIGGATKGMNIEDSDPEDYIAEVSVSDP